MLGEQIALFVIAGVYYFCTVRVMITRQPSILSLLLSGVQPSATSPFIGTDIATNLNSFLIIIEMFVAMLLLAYAFPYTDLKSEKKERPSSELNEEITAQSEYHALGSVDLDERRRANP